MIIALFVCDSGGIQTHNLLIRSQMLYSVELRNQSVFFFCIFRNQTYDCDSGGIQTHNLLIRSQMLYSVELRNRRLALISEMRCKGTHFLRNHQNFSLFF